jgi:hypothetical protein
VVSSLWILKHKNVNTNLGKIYVGVHFLHTIPFWVSSKDLSFKYVNTLILAHLFSFIMCLKEFPTYAKFFPFMVIPCLTWFWLCVVYVVYIWTSVLYNHTQIFIFHWLASALCISNAQIRVLLRSWCAHACAAQQCSDAVTLTVRTSNSAMDPELLGFQTLSTVQYSRS